LPAANQRPPEKALAGLHRLPHRLDLSLDLGSEVSSTIFHSAELIEVNPEHASR